MSALSLAQKTLESCRAARCRFVRAVVKLSICFMLHAFSSYLFATWRLCVKAGGSFDTVDLDSMFWLSEWVCGWL